MDNETKKTAIIDALKGDVNNNEKNKYYVYALCERTSEGNLIPFYIGKGDGDRVWQHEEGKEKEIKKIEQTVANEEERNRKIEELSEKYKRIHKLGSSKIEKVIIKWGMTNNEAFMAESALINIFRLDGIKFDIAKAPLTNIDNGHHSEGEAKSLCYTKARTIEEFYNDCALPPIDLNDIHNVVLISINRGYEECKNIESSKRDAAVRDAVRGFWKLRNNTPNIVFAMYQQKVVGVYRIKHQYIEKRGKRSVKKEEILYTILDVNRPDYPRNDSLPIRVNDYAIAKKIYDFFDKDTDGRVTKNVCYKNLSKELKKEFRNYQGELNEGQSYESAFANWAKRKYYVLEDIADNDPDAFYKQYLNCRIIRSVNGKATAPIPPRNYIKYSDS